MSKKGILKIFHDYFHRLGACNTKLTLEIQQKNEQYDENS